MPCPSDVVPKGALSSQEILKTCDLHSRRPRPCSCSCLQLLNTFIPRSLLGQKSTPQAFFKGHSGQLQEQSKNKPVIPRPHRNVSAKLTYTNNKGREGSDRAEQDTAPSLRLKSCSAATSDLGAASSTSVNRSFSAGISAYKAVIPVANSLDYQMKLIISLPKRAS